jgi:hypothetical protein
MTMPDEKRPAEVSEAQGGPNKHLDEGNPVALYSASHQLGLPAKSLWQIEPALDSGDIRPQLRYFLPQNDSLGT